MLLEYGLHFCCRVQSCLNLRLKIRQILKSDAYSHQVGIDTERFCLGGRCQDFKSKTVTSKEEAFTYPLQFTIVSQ